MSDILRFFYVIGCYLGALSGDIASEADFITNTRESGEIKETGLNPFRGVQDFKLILGGNSMAVHD